MTTDTCEECARLRRFIMALADRLAAASEVIGKLAEPVDKARLKRIANGEDIE